MESNKSSESFKSQQTNGVRRSTLTQTNEKHKVSPISKAHNSTLNSAHDPNSQQSNAELQLREQLDFQQKMMNMHIKERDNMYGHLQMLYSVLNNVIFTLNQHAVVINKEVLPFKDNYLESKVMFRMFQNVVSGLESETFLGELAAKESSNVFNDGKNNFNQSLLSHDHGVPGKKNLSGDSGKIGEYGNSMTSNIEGGGRNSKKSYLSSDSKDSRRKSKFNSPVVNSKDTFTKSPNNSANSSKHSRTNKKE